MTHHCDIARTGPAIVRHDNPSANYPSLFAALLNVRFWPIPACQDAPVRWSRPMQMAGQVECKQVVNSVQLPIQRLGQSISFSVGLELSWGLGILDIKTSG